MQQALVITVILGLVHALVDACCAVTVHNARLFHHLAAPEGFYLILTYDLLAFGAQPFFGLLTDKFRIPLSAALVGVVLTALSMALLAANATIAAVLAGCGNALYHIGAGALIIYLCFGKATLPGIFVAPGALGLAYGIWLGKAGSMLLWPFLALLFVSFFVMRRLAVPKIPYDEPPPPKIPYTGLILLLLLFAVAIRSIGGGLGNGFAPKGVQMGFILAGAAFAGKALGGYVSDKLGWIKTTVIALLASSALVFFGFQHVPLLVLAVFLFQFPMPVTLAAIALLFPRKPAFAFGLTCLALIAGSLPLFYRVMDSYYNPAMYAGLSTVAALAIFLGLMLMQKGPKPA